ncbi:MAG: bifunctional diaminohydroxyphosphoribosylaminopyrimidine deaminase/5-amino-6-(5-phosphoribosylamino)uracil reductase RibD [Flavobacteriales bacterium]|nr:bifunctional diaminohydroxyphosphoribosylaminopyrimidine deaminase/5-amino-6-(5-phosphoribosylamino)uracil reductase RibD [Flavobacteriales bacterium]
MQVDKQHIAHCNILAMKGMGNVAPNPMVGCVIVHQNKIIGKGYHEEYGKAHAEVNAINSVADKSLLKESTLYVNLEPCAHFGKTPPCSDLIIEHQIPRVVIACIDSFSEVSGKGIQKMKAAGTEVIVGVLETEGLELNKRFFIFHNKKRPCIILKWAQTKDGFIDIDRSSLNQNDKVDNWITTPESKQLVHFWRSEEQAIMIGTNTALNDNPKLTVREVDGENPLRIVLDLNLRLSENLHLFDKTVPTIVFNYQKNKELSNLDFVKIDQNKDLIQQVLNELYNREIQSVIIEGGAQLLNTFIEQNLWDEARVFTGKKEFKKGLEAPKIRLEPKFTMEIESDILRTYFND